MTLPVWFAVLCAAVAVGLALAEVVQARRRGRPVRATRVAAFVTVGVLAAAAAVLLGFSAVGALGVPRRYATYGPARTVSPTAVLVGAGLVAGVVGLVRADRAARAAERSGEGVAQAARTTNVVLVLAGVGLALLGVLAMLT